MINNTNEYGCFHLHRETDKGIHACVGMCTSTYASTCTHTYRHYIFTVNVTGLDGGSSFDDVLNKALWSKLRSTSGNCVESEEGSLVLTFCSL